MRKLTLIGTFALSLMVFLAPSFAQYSVCQESGTLDVYTNTTNFVNGTQTNTTAEVEHRICPNGCSQELDVCIPDNYIINLYILAAFIGFIVLSVLIVVLVKDSVIRAIMFWVFALIVLIGITTVPDFIGNDPTYSIILTMFPILAILIGLVLILKGDK